MLGILLLTYLGTTVLTGGLAVAHSLSISSRLKREGYISNENNISLMEKIPGLITTGIKCAIPILNLGMLGVFVFYDQDKIYEQVKNQMLKKKSIRLPNEVEEIVPEVLGYPYDDSIHQSNNKIIYSRPSYIVNNSTSQYDSKIIYEKEVINGSQPIYEYNSSNGFQKEEFHNTYNALPEDQKAFYVYGIMGEMHKQILETDSNEQEQSGYQRIRKPQN